VKRPVDAGEGGFMATVAKKTNIANWFEVPVKDLGRATRFYEKVFDVKMTFEEMNGMKMAMFPMDQDAPGTTGALMQAETYEPSHAGTVVYFTVESIEETLRKINANGGKMFMPKTAIGQYGFIAQYEDTEGNRLALHSMT
jgi:predicted enzyme related to lactoylglutathione lyase